MNTKKSSFLPQNRRGLSSVVGALFFTVLMIAGFTVLSLALDAQTDIVTTQRIISDVEIKKQQEDFRILPSSNASNFLSISVDNRGQNPVEISSIWITNRTLPDQPVKRYDVSYDNAFIPSGLASDVISSQDIKLISDTYDIKVISSLGSIETAEFTVGSGVGSDLRAELITDPPDVIIGQNVTVAMLVTNTGFDMIYNVQPSSLDVTGSGIVSSSSSHTPSFVDLNGGASVMFSWDYKVTGNSGDQLIFEGNATGNGGAITAQVSDISILREPTDGGSGGGGEGEEIVIKHELFAKPEIFMILPNLVATKGDGTNDRPIWGVMVANPTDQAMYVNKVVISSISPRDTADDIIFKEGCYPDESGFTRAAPISPTTNFWSCPAANQVVWKNTDDPQLIEPRSVFPFLVAIGSEAVGGSTVDAVNVLIQPVVFTTLGQFSTAAYGTTVFSKESASVNVFLTRDSESVNYSDIMGEQRAITEGTPETFYATIVDMDDNSYRIESESELIINIPQDWTLNEPICSTCYVGFHTPIINTFQDGSKQIVGELNTSIRNPNQAKSIEFSMTAPLVSNTKMYVLHILAYGTATGEGNGDLNVGAISETVLQVCPTIGC